MAHIKEYLKKEKESLILDAEGNKEHGSFGSLNRGLLKCRVSYACAIF